MGGNKGRKQGKKHQSAATHNLRVVNEDGEMYAVFTKLYGGSSSEVTCSDGKTRLCVIRNKFRGRNRRDNRASVGTACLVGIREWESARALQTVDLLHVYSAEHKLRLKKEVNIDWGWLPDESSLSEDNGSFKFQDDELANTEEDPDAPICNEVVASEAAINVDDI